LHESCCFIYFHFHLNSKIKTQQNTYKHNHESFDLVLHLKKKKKHKTQPKSTHGNNLRTSSSCSLLLAKALYPLINQSLFQCFVAIVCISINIHQYPPKNHFLQISTNPIIKMVKSYLSFLRLTIIVFLPFFFSK